MKKMRILKYQILLLTVLLSTGVNSQWCCLDSVFQIKDLSTINLRLLINGAVNNDLSSPGQGVCGVKIKFDHKFIGDLTMDLISPSGQRIQLIGPVGNSGNSDFSKWFVTFRRCQDTVNPDPGFKPVWDNIQSWGILGRFYSGTYKPHAACLEDFNMGSVNGTWTLTVRDDERFYEGKIESFCL
jgi:subtilisin-like proprotein convertase family protein